MKEYCDLLNSYPGLYYEVINEDLNEIWKENPIVKISCLNAMFIHLAKDMGKEEFFEEVDFQFNIHFKEGKVPQEINKVVNRIKEEKSR